MRVYFLSYLPAVLKLNGLYVGTIDLFERHIEIDPQDNILAEIVPGDNLVAANFFLDDKFFKNPPPFADVYTMGDDALIYIREYAVKDVKINVILQTRFGGNLITVFAQGGIYLSVDGTQFMLEPLPRPFAVCRAEEKTLGGRNVLAVYGGDYLLILSDSGKKIFLNRVTDAQFGENLKVCVAFETCTAAQAECVFEYDGDKLTLSHGKTVEMRPPEKEILHFAFFESVLTCGDFVKYLDSSLLQKSGDLKSYLGDFISVTVPTEKFYELNGNIAAAGLVYPKAKNLFEIKYYAVEFNGDKISNIFPVG